MIDRIIFLVSQISVVTTEQLKSDILAIVYGMTGTLFVTIIGLLVWIWNSHIKGDKSEKALFRKAIEDISETLQLLRIQTGKHDTKFEENDRWKERVEEHIFPVKYSK
jgi:hypothetical protein